MDACVEGDHRVPVTIEPWCHKDSFEKLIRHGTEVRFVKGCATKPGHIKVAIDYPTGRAVNTELPAAALNLK